MRTPARRISLSSNTDWDLYWQPKQSIFHVKIHQFFCFELPMSVSVAPRDKTLLVNGLMLTTGEVMYLLRQKIQNDIP